MVVLTEYKCLNVGSWKTLMLPDSSFSDFISISLSSDEKHISSNGKI